MTTPLGKFLTKEQADARLEEILPCTEEYIDCAGCMRVFRLYRQYQAFTVGYLLSADEVRPDGAVGYHFEAFSEACPFTALTALRSKIERELSRKYLRYTDHGMEMTHDMVRGNIQHDGVTVDGQHVGWNAFIKLLTTFEGFQFELHVADASNQHRIR